MANKHNEEYRGKAVDYVLGSGRSIRGCARELSLKHKSLGHWILNDKLIAAPNVTLLRPGEFSRHKEKALGITPEEAVLSI